MSSVYIETTIPSFYCDTRTEVDIVAWQRATQLWWNRYRHAYRLCTSAFTYEEVAEAPEPKASRGLELLRDVEVLGVPDGFEQLVEHYVDQHLVPRGADAAHLAMASLHGIDFLLTWNCRHLANSNKVRHLSVLNGRLGLPVPMVVTPLTLLPETEA